MELYYCSFEIQNSPTKVIENSIFFCGCSWEVITLKLDVIFHQAFDGLKGLKTASQEKALRFYKDLGWSLHFSTTQKS